MQSVSLYVRSSATNRVYESGYTLQVLYILVSLGKHQSLPFTNGQITLCYELIETKITNILFIVMHSTIFLFLLTRLLKNRIFNASAQLAVSNSSLGFKNY